MDAFRHIDEFKHGVINIDNLRYFLKRHEQSATLEEGDLEHLIKKYDKGGDNAWSFKEFIAAVNPLL